MTFPRDSVPKVLSLAVFLLMSFCCGYAQNNDDGCTNASLKGEFGFSITGTNAGVGPFATVGRFVSDGKGNITGVATEAILPVIGPNQAFTATYTVTSECAGSAVLTFTDSGAATHLNFVLVDRGREILIIVTDRGAVESGSAKKQFPQHPPEHSDRT
jgi:hypothetical protein